MAVFDSKAQIAENVCLRAIVGDVQDRHLTAEAEGLQEIDELAARLFVERPKGFIKKQQRGLTSQSSC